MDVGVARELIEGVVRMACGMGALIWAARRGLRPWQVAALAGRMVQGSVLLMAAAGACAVIGWARGGRGGKNAERTTAGKQTQ